LNLAHSLVEQFFKLPLMMAASLPLRLHGSGLWILNSSMSTTALSSLPHAPPRKPHTAIAQDSQHVRCLAGKAPQESDDDPFEIAESASGSSKVPSRSEPSVSYLSAQTLRKLASSADALEVLDMLTGELGTDATLQMCESDCMSIMEAALQRGNAPLAQSIFQAMTCSATTGPSLSALNSSNPASLNSFRWPAATPATASELVLGLCRALQIREAVSVINSVRARGLPSASDVQFGYVVECPGAAQGKPLAVVQPQEGVKAVADSYTRYECELFSGRVESTASESLVTNAHWFFTAAQRAGFLQRPRAGAVHTALIEAPSGQQRTFRFGTITQDVPMKVGDRVTLVCAPHRPFFSQRRMLSAAPPGCKPGEPLAVSNHTVRTSVQLLRPPDAGSTSGSGAPAWLLPAVALLVASDAASSIVDPVLPYLIAGVAVTTAASVLAGTNVIIPRLKQLPERSVELQASRQKLLGQYVALDRRVAQLVEEGEEDVRILARLWQLQNKMGSVSAGGGGGATSYDARLERVTATRAAIEARLGKRIEAIDAYARVLNMIEIEVEMETDVPMAEVEGIEIQIERLKEIEALQEEWELQAEAQDEVERLLRATPP